MQTKKLLLLSAGVIAIVALLAAANAFAQFDQCTSTAFARNGNEIAGNYVVTVTQQVVDGRRIYTYEITSPTDTNPNKFFLWVRRGLDSEGYTASCTNSSGDCGGGDYVKVTGPQQEGNFPPQEAWRTVAHEDGISFQQVAINNQFSVNVQERYQPGTSLTTVSVGTSNSDERCGPIYGPTNPTAFEYEGETRVQTTARICFENGCCYFADVELTTGRVLHLEGDPATPEETNYPQGEQPRACVADNNADCAGDLGIPSCGVGNILYPPVHSEDGGTCYYPANINFPC